MGGEALFNFPLQPCNSDLVVVARDCGEGEVRNF